MKIQTNTFLFTLYHNSQNHSILLTITRTKHFDSSYFLKKELNVVSFYIKLSFAAKTLYRNCLKAYMAIIANLYSVKGPTIDSIADNCLCRNRENIDPTSHSRFFKDFSETFSSYSFLCQIHIGLNQKHIGFKNALYIA